MTQNGLVRLFGELQGDGGSDDEVTVARVEKSDSGQLGRLKQNASLLGALYSSLGFFLPMA